MANHPDHPASAPDLEDTSWSPQSPPAFTESILYRINAGSTDVAAIDGGPVWTGDLALENGTGPVSVTGDVEHEFTSKSTDSEAEVTYPDPDVAAYAPWQLFVHERHDKIKPLPNDDAPLTYNFDVETGATYKITLLYVENWTGAFRPENDRIFDVEVDGAAFVEFADLNPLGEAAAALGQPLPPTPSKMPAKQPFLGTVITRELVDTRKLATWLSTFDNPSSMDNWSDVFASPQGMAELHNTKLFLRALADQLDGSVVDPLIAAPLAELVQGFTQLI